VSIAEATTDAQGNAQPYSVSELSFALRRTLEDAYGFVRLRGELSKVTFHSNGHVYLSIKDDKACIDGVVWKSSVRGLQVRPEQGMEVIVTGKVTTYPAGSRYQIIIEAMEPAGVGALLAQLEKLKAKLQGEGLFDPARKRPLPSMPATVGVITSPTGAVIRDILHRIRDRWPCRVVVWPVVVQGDQAAGQVIAAIEGFNRFETGGEVPRPEVLIVARGGGSVEDLWAFNDERLARAAAASAIPLISAVGHETDTTLIDFVSDRRAPTPTAAAEMATPVLAELKALTADFQRRLLTCGQRTIEHRRTRLTAASRGLPRPMDILALANQRFDHASSRLGAGLERNVAAHRVELAKVAGRLTPGMLDRPRRQQGERLAGVAARMQPAALRLLARAGERMESLDKLRQSLNPKRPFERGFALVRHQDGRLATVGADLAAGETISLEFLDATRQAIVDGESPPSRPPRAEPPPPKGALKPGKGARANDPGQGDLF
jgi:exodeoxyribonuclease VII large subunit